jgi:galactose mutarotase-like enzyme
MQIGAGLRQSSRDRLAAEVTMPFDSLILASGAVRAEVVPARGALVAALAVDGRDVLYLDRATLDDPAKNVRGGIPVLFPFAGRLADDTLRAAGTQIKRAKQHGFGRNRAWRVVEQGGASLRMALGADGETRAQYPFEFAVEQSVRLLPRGLQIELAVADEGVAPLPVSPGWHPYFACPAAAKGAVRGDVAGFTPDRIGDDREFDFGVEAPRHGRARFEVPGLGRLAIEFSPDMRHMQFWSLPGKPFICIEPFFGPNDTINTDRRALVEPGACRTFWMRIELVD